MQDMAGAHHQLETDEGIGRNVAQPGVHTAPVFCNTERVSSWALAQMRSGQPSR